MADDDGMTLGEIGRRMTDLVAEVRGMRSEVVRLDVWMASRRADEIRLTTIEADLARQDGDRSAMRRLFYGAMISGGISLALFALAMLVKR